MHRFYTFIFLFALVIMMPACTRSPSGDKKVDAIADSLATLGFFGLSVDTAKALTVSEFLVKMNENDSLPVILRGRISANCEHSGCWMEIDLENGQAVRVKFRDEKFTVPLDSKGKVAVISGLALKTIILPEELKKIALEEGVSQENADTIKTPQTEFSFIADGVYIKK